MRILFVCGGGYVYGKEIITLSLMGALRERGHEVMCLTSTWNDGDFIERMTKLTIPYKKIPLGFISKRLSRSATLMTLDQMRKLPELWLGYNKSLLQFDPDLVLHTNLHHVFLLLPLLGRHKNVFHVHDLVPQTSIHRCLLRILGLRIKRFVGVSRFIASSLVLAGVPRYKVSHVLNGVVADEPNGNHYREPLQFQAKERRAECIVIGIVGQIGDWKGHEELMEALSILKEDGVSFVCKVFGSGDPDYLEALKRRVKNLGLTAVVEWSGFVRTGKEMFTGMDVCVVPTRFAEPFGLVAAEAALMGVPAIVTRCGGLSEIVRDHETGYLVDVGNAQQLAEKIQLLAQSRELRESMGIAARHHAMEHLTSSRMATEMESVLLSVAAAKRN